MQMRFVTRPRLTTYRSVVCVGILLTTILGSKCPCEPSTDAMVEHRENLASRISLIPMFAHGQLFQGNYFHEKYFPMNRIDPTAQKYILFYLGKGMKANEYPPRTEGIWLLGFVGDKEALSFLRRYTKWALEWSEFSRWDRTNDFGGLIGACVGMMVRREIDGADDFLRSYADFASWTPDERRANQDENAGQNKAHTAFLRSSYRYSRDARILPFLGRAYPGQDGPIYDADMLAKLRAKRPYYDELVQPCGVPEDKLNFYYDKCFEIWGKRIDALIAEADGRPIMQPASEEERSVSPTTEVLPNDAASIAHGHDDAVSDRSALTHAELADVREMIGEALAAYRRIAALVVAGNTDAVLPNLLDEDQPLDLDKVARLRKEFDRDFGREGEILRLLDERGSKPAEFSVCLELDYHASGMSTEDGAGTMTKLENITVTFPLSDSAELGGVHFARQRGSLTVAEDGTLIVVMKKINGEWYWNPFGW